MSDTAVFEWKQGSFTHGARDRNSWNRRPNRPATNRQVRSEPGGDRDAQSLIILLGAAAVAMFARSATAGESLLAAWERVRGWLGGFPG